MNNNKSVEPARIPRVLEFALAVTALAWVGAAKIVAGKAAQGLSLRFGLGEANALLEALFLLFLTVLGFGVLERLATSGRGESALHLPRRKTAAIEWGTGAAIGWALCLLAALPLLLSRNIHARLNLQPGTLGGVALASATLLVAALAQEVIFRGYVFQRMIRAVGPTLATLLLAAGFAVSLLDPASLPQHPLLAFVDGILLGVLLSLAWLRTHALWLGWGANFGYRVVMAVALGLPIAGHGAFGSLTDTYTTGRSWLSGGAFGLDAALLTSIVLLAGCGVLYRVTREWAWEYTHAPIMAAGYEVTVAPPAAHVAMEKVAAPPPLIQIMSTTSQSPVVVAPPPPPPAQ